MVFTDNPIHRSILTARNQPNSDDNTDLVPSVDVDIPFVANYEHAYPDPSSAGAAHEHPYFGSSLLLMYAAPSAISFCSMPTGKSHYAENELQRPVERIGMTPPAETTVDGELNTDGQVMATVDGLPSEVSGGTTHARMPRVAPCLTARFENAGGALYGGGISSDTQSLPVPVSTRQDRQDTGQLTHVGRKRQPSEYNEKIQIRQFAINDPKSGHGKIGKKTIGRILKKKKRPSQGDISTDAINNARVEHRRAPKRLSNKVKTQMCRYHQKNPNVTQKAIAEEFGVHQSTVSLILRVHGQATFSETGSSSPRLCVVLSIIQPLLTKAYVFRKRNTPKMTMQNEQWHPIKADYGIMPAYQASDANQFTVFTPIGMSWGNVSPPYQLLEPLYYQFLDTSGLQAYPPQSSSSYLPMSETNHPRESVQASPLDESPNTAHLEANARLTSTVTSTSVDKMMIVIQGKTGSGPANDKSPSLHLSESTSSGIAKPKKKWCPACGQKVLNLERHMFTHTGKKPYSCEHPGCGKSFTQKGNLKTHGCQHTGERPHVCVVCDKRFAQGGGLQSHKKVHDRTKRFTCRIGNCSTTFKHSGGLKAHQNKFHAQYIMELTEKLANDINALTDEERKLCIEFADVYKHLNKGIRGRGRGLRAVAVAQAHSAPQLALPQLALPQLTEGHTSLHHGL
ncbi:hypothetical protein PG985_016362 [Apiospora marii]|uniref:uncharacterized protein n=1 Tax=Apiospora marii TaxID=335849 RepID=UPI00312EB465